MPTPLKVAFAGTPDFAAQHLEGLIDSPHQIVSVMSQPDRPAGRGKRLQHSPVKTVALAAGLPVWQPESLKTADSAATLSDYQADILVVVAYGLILPAAILRVPRLGCLNVHASLLPRWRGAAPVQRAIEAGDAEDRRQHYGDGTRFRYRTRAPHPHTSHRSPSHRRRAPQ